MRKGKLKHGKVCQRCGNLTIAKGPYCIECQYVSFIKFNCSECGKPSTIAPISKMRQILLGRDSLCRSCIQRKSALAGAEKVKGKRVTLVCPMCGNTREYSPAVAADHKTALCRKCTDASRSRKVGPRSKNRDPLSINGCIIMPALASERCLHYENCKNGMYCDLFGRDRGKQDCCYQAAMVDWQGFTCGENAKPDLISPEEWILIRQITLEQANRRESYNVVIHAYD